MTTLPIAQIRMDGGTQPRAGLDWDAIEAYTEALEAGAKFPPVTVFYDGVAYWLADGFHRITAAQSARVPEFPCDVHQGTVEDAQWFSFGANKTNGLLRTNKDKQRAVQAALKHPRAVGRSDEKIAAHVGVSRQYVWEWRQKIAPATCKQMTSGNASNGDGKKRLCADGRTMDVSNIGKRRSVVTADYSQETPSDETETTEAEVADSGRNASPTRPAPPAAQPQEADIAQPEEQPICSGKVAGSTPAVGSKIPAPPKPEPSKPDPEAGRAAVTAHLYGLKNHSISAADYVSGVPDEEISELHRTARAVFEFVGFVFEATGKRQKR